MSSKSILALDISDSQGRELTDRDRKDIESLLNGEESSHIMLVTSGSLTDEECTFIARQLARSTLDLMFLHGSVSAVFCGLSFFKKNLLGLLDGDLEDSLQRAFEILKQRRCHRMMAVDFSVIFMNSLEEKDLVVNSTKPSIADMSVQFEEIPFIKTKEDTMKLVEN